MVTWEELVAAIQAAPDDDAPRLVAADWLLARPSPVDGLRGEHIQLSVELARLQRDDDARRSAVVQRLAEIPTSAWSDPLRELGVQVLSTDRGFVDGAALQGDSIRNVGELLRREPITRLELYGDLDERSLAALAASSARPVTLRVTVDDAGLATLARAGALDRVEKLDLVNSRVTRHGAGPLGALPRLRELDLRFVPDLYFVEAAIRELGARVYIITRSTAVDDDGEDVRHLMYEAAIEDGGDGD
jgi:uncharacterized protein (TIGR02996 family)